MTSNLGSNLWLDRRQVTREEIVKTLQEHFKPEFLNRIDEIVIFHSLGREQLNQIVNIQLKHVEKLLSERDFRLEVTPAAREYLAEAGYDPDYGARPLKRAIQWELQDPLALRILNGDFPTGSVIVVDRGGDGLTFNARE
jgi:ATP-dependent Clp protease ATP-binding subunit ClpB